MSVLCYSEIKYWMENPIIEKRLIITPLINPKKCLGTSSIDVRLGNQFIVMKRQSFPLLDISNPEKLINNIGRYQEKVVVKFQQQFTLHPGQLVLGSTLEYVKIPSGLMCYMIGKSTWGRLGLIIATATKIDPGFTGCITLEIINEGEVPLVLYPGIPIAQLVFHRTSENDESLYRGKYNCPIGPQFPMLKIDSDFKFWIKK